MFLWLTRLFSRLLSLFIMPITGPSSYPPTVVLFLSHWESSNTIITTGPVVLEDGTSRAGLVTLQSSLETARDAVTDATVELSFARSSLILLVTALQARAVEFNARVRGDLSGTAFPGALPEAFSVGQGESSVRECLRRVSRVWDKINQLGSASPAGVTQPFALSDGYLLANLDADRDALRDAYRAVSDAEVDAAIARGTRNKVQDEIYGVLKSYRKKLSGYEREYPQLFTTLPALTPAPGHTPDAVAAQVVWDVPAEKARVTWSEVTDSSVVRVEVRGCAGDRYVPDDEVLLASLLPGATREVLTEFALNNPGLTAGFKVYSVTETGNERGSEAVYVQRP